jgi:glutathione S-transferase
MALPKLIYFASRGRAEVIRLVAAEAALAYEEENFKDFPALKASGRLPFLAVPVWVEDGFTLAQSMAIANHIGRAHGMRGASPREEAQIDQAFLAVEDVRSDIRRLTQIEVSKRPELRAELKASTLPRWFGQLEKLLGSHRGGTGFIASESISVADLALWYLIEIAKDNDFGLALGDCPKLNAFYERIAARPKIAAYLGSSKRWPLTKLP